MVQSASSNLSSRLRLQFGLASYITAENGSNLSQLIDCLEYYFKIYLRATPSFIEKVYQD